MGVSAPNGTYVGETLADPLLNSQFKVWTEGRGGGYLPKDKVGFDHVGGLGTGTTEAIPYRPGNSRITRQLIGNTSFHAVTMSKGLDKGGHIMRWRLRIWEGSSNATARENNGGARPTDSARAEFLCIGITDRVVDEIHIQEKLHEAWPGESKLSELQGGDKAGVMMEEVTFHFDSPEFGISAADRGNALVNL